MGGPGISDTSVRTSTLSAQILISKYHHLIEGTRAPWRKMADSRLTQTEYKMSLEHLIVPERKYSENTRRFLDRGMQRDIGADLKWPNLE